MNDSVTVERGEKRLHHIQAVIGWFDYPVDIFVFSKGYPSEDQIIQLLIDEYDMDAIEDKAKIQDILELAETYTLYAREI